MLTSWSVGFAARNPKTPQPPELRLLLDQGFPSPPGFTVRAIDQTMEVVTLHDFDHLLAENSTPDWVIYCLAAQAGFDALVTRDQAQLGQPLEMVVLSRLPMFTVITWKKAVEDPIREWGQLLAYLPEVKKLLRGAGGTKRPDSILLPAPTLSQQNVRRAGDTVGVEAHRRGVSTAQVVRGAQAEIADWLDMMGRSADEFNQLLHFGKQS
jgi:hypothetical protein